MSKTHKAGATAPSQIATDGLYGDYEIHRIRISPDNRKRFNEAALQELAQSIKAIGLAQPILIRPVTPTEEAPQEFEIVAGERRYRASKIAGRETIPAVCRVLSDSDAAKLRILENLQREDPHPIEEAEGYQLLMLQHGYSADQLADEVHKSRAYIYARLKLCALTTEVREQFLDNKIPPSTALLVARIPVPALQVRALSEILNPPVWQGGGEPMSYRMAAQYIQDRYMLDLSTAIFKVADARLLAAAGACTACPKRTGNQPELFAGISADVCTDPDCFGEKRAAQHAATLVFANKKGIPVLEGSEGWDVVSKQHSSNQSELVTENLALWNFERNAPSSKNNGTPKAILGAEGMPPVATYVKNDDGSVTAMYTRAAVQAALEVAGACETIEQHAERLKVAESSAPKVKGNEAAAAAERALEENKKTAADLTSYRVALYKQLRHLGATSGFSLQSLREFTKLAVREHALPDDLLGDIYEFDTTSDDSVCAYVDTAGLPEIQLLLIDLMIGECLSVDSWDVKHGRVNDDNFSTVVAMAKHEGIDPDQVKESMFPSPINVGNMQHADLVKFIETHPSRINELKDAVLADQTRANLVSLLEVAANGLGYVYGVDGFQLVQAAPVAAATESSKVALEPEDGGTVACDGEDLEAAIAEPAPAKKAPKAKPGAKQTAAPASPAAPLDPAAPSKAKPATKKSSLSPAAAWPFPKSSAEAIAPKTAPAAAAQAEATNPSTEEAAA